MWCSTAGFSVKNLVALYRATTSLKSWFSAFLANLKCFNGYETSYLDFLTHFWRFLKVWAQEKNFCIIFWASPNSKSWFMATLANLKCFNNYETSYFDFLSHFWRFLKVSAREKNFWIIFWRLQFQNHDFRPFWLNWMTMKLLRY